MSVTSVAVPPVERFAVDRRYTVRPAPGPVGREIRGREHFLRLSVELEPRQNLLMPDAAARILVHDLDQLFDGVRPSPTTWPACAAWPRPVRR